MSHSAEQISVPADCVPLPWLDEPWPVERGQGDLTASSAGSDGAAFDGRKKSSIHGAASALSLAFWADVSHASGVATPDRGSTAPVTTPTSPRQGNSPSRPTAYCAATAILWLVGLGLLALVAILAILAGASHGVGFGGAHDAYHVHGVSR